MPSVKRPPPPGSWAPARGAARRVLAPIERILAVEASSGVLLLLAALLALGLANSPWRDAYHRIWETQVGFRLGPLVFERDLRFVVNDGLMTVFFFVVGLEIRRELHRGELSDLRRATLPLAAALGGMVVPAGLYLAVAGGAAARGWGVPMATDIAFAVGVLTLLGDRVPRALRVLLLALAVIDDVGGILVIAVFYSSDIALAGFVFMGVGVLIILGQQFVGVRSPFAYVLPALVVWGGAYAAGIHPTLAGVIVGLLTPVTPWFETERVEHEVESALAGIREVRGQDEQALLPHLDVLGAARAEAVSPVERIQHALHGWVAFGIVPLFAFANAGVTIGGSGESPLAGAGGRVLLGVALGLVVGKPLGIVTLSWLSVRAGLANLPRGVTFRQLSVVGLVAGIGFTMAIFIAQLAFPPGPSGEANPLLSTAKLAILGASALSATLTFALGPKLLGSGSGPGAARTDAEAESSTEL